MKIENAGIIELQLDSLKCSKMENIKVFDNLIIEPLITKNIIKCYKFVIYFIKHYLGIVK